MSVVNKMLKDLEARQSQTDEVNVDYQPPQKKQSKLLVLVLLTLAVAAIIFAIKDKVQLFGKNPSSQTTISAKVQSVPPKSIKKMTVASKEKQLDQTLDQPSKSENKLIESELKLALKSNILTLHETTLQEPITIINKSPSSEELETPSTSLETRGIAKLNTQQPPEKKSSFSMADSNQKNSTSILKQRIAESLNNNNFDIAQPLLNELLASEPSNIKARKKLASLLFAQGQYAQSKQLLLNGVELHPSQSDLRLMLARLYAVQKEPSKAMDILSAIQPNTDNQSEYLAYRAALAQQLKQTKLAKSDYQTLTDIEPTNAKWWLGLAIARDQLGEKNKAAQAYSKASSLDQLEGSVAEFIQQRISVLTGIQ